MPNSFVLQMELQTRLSGVTSAYNQIKNTFRPISVPVTIGGAEAGQRAQDIQRLAAAGESVTASFRGAGAATSAMTAQIQGMSRAVSESNGLLANLASQAGVAAKRFIGWGVAAGSILSLVTSIKSGISEAVTFDRVMNQMAQVTSGTAQEINSIRAEITRLSTTLGTSSSDLAETALAFRQAGLSIKDVKASLEAVSQISGTGQFRNIKEIYDATIASMAQFNLSGKDVAATLGSINAIAGATATEGRDLSVSVTRMGGAFASAGGSLNEMLALFASVRSASRESAESIATGLRTTIVRASSGRAIDYLKELGVELRHTSEESHRLFNDDRLTGQNVGPWETVRRISEAFRNLPTTSPQFADLTQVLGGYRQVSKVINLLTNFGEAQKILSVAQLGAASTAFAAEKAQESLATQFSKTKEKWLELMRSFTDSSSFRAATSDLLSLANGLIRVIDAARPLLPVLTSIAAVKLFTGVAPLARTFAYNLSAGVRPRAFARGGVVPGSPSDTDNTPAMLQSGEFVVRKKAAQQIGYDALHALNEGRKPSRFAFGGSATDEINRLLASGGLSQASPDLWERLDAELATKHMPPANLPGSRRGLTTSSPANRAVANLRKQYLRQYRGRNPEVPTTDDVEVFPLDNTRGTMLIERLGLPLALQAAGVLPGSTTNVFSDHRHVMVESTGGFESLGLPSDEEAYSMTRRIMVGESGLRVHNDLLHVHEALRGRPGVPGPQIASRIYLRQLASLASGDVEKIDLQAAGSKNDASGFSGYSVWPIVFGAEGKINKRLFKKLLGQQAAQPGWKELLRGRDSVSVQSILAQQGGRDAWENAGNAFKATISGNSELVWAKALERIGKVRHLAGGGFIGDMKTMIGRYTSVTPQNLAALLVGLGLSGSDDAKMLSMLARTRKSDAASIVADGSMSRRGAIKQMAKGGHLDGQSSKDEILSLLMPGEFVLNKRAAASIGQAELHRMNAFGHLPRFATGGSVGGSKMTFEQVQNSPDQRIAALGTVIQDAASKAGQSLYAFTEVLIRQTKKITEFVGFVPKQGPATSEAEAAKRHGLRVLEPRLPRDIREQLMEKTPLASYLANQFDYKRRLGSDDEALAAASAYQWQQTRTFQPAELAAKNPEIAAAIAAGDYNHPSIKNAYRGFIIQAASRHLQREADKRKQVNPTDIVGNVAYHPVSREAAVDSPERLSQIDRDEALRLSLLSASRQDIPARLGDPRSLVDVARRSRALRLSAGIGSPPRIPSTFASQGGVPPQPSIYGFAPNSPANLLDYLPGGPVDVGGHGNDDFWFRQRTPISSGIYGFADLPRGQRIADNRGRFSGLVGDGSEIGFDPNHRYYSPQDLARIKARAAETLDQIKAKKLLEDARSGLNQFGGEALDVRGLVQQRADQFSGRAIAARGRSVSEETRSVIEQESLERAQGKIRRDLLSAEESLLRALHQRVPATERSKIAEENVAKALAGELEVVRKNGVLLGTRGTVNQATEALVSARGRTAGSYLAAPIGDFLEDTRFGRAISRAGGAVSRPFGSIARGIGRFNDSLVGRGIGAFASTPVALTLPYTAMIADHMAGDVESSAKGGVAAAQNYAQYRGYGGAIQGAVVGGTLGSVGGPAGIVAGAALGGIYGFVTSLKEAEQEIRQIKIGEALNRLGDSLNSLSNQLHGDKPLDAAIAASTREHLATVNAQTRERSAAEATSFFGGFDVSRYLAQDNRAFRENFIGSAPIFIQTLNREANRIGRANTNNRSLNDLESELVSGNGGLNRSLIESISRVRGVSTLDVTRELRRELEAGNRQGQTDRANRAGRVAIESADTAFGRLALNVQGAADSITLLRDRSRVLADAFDGVQGPISVSAHTNRLAALGRNDDAFLQPLSMIRGIGGSAGAAMFEHGQTLNSISRILPDVLAETASRDFSEGADLVTSLRQSLTRRLGFTTTNLPAQYRDQLDVIGRNANHILENGGIGNFRDQFSADPGRLSETLLGPQADSLRTHGSAILRELETTSNSFIEGLSRLSRATHQIGESLDRAAAARGQGFRQSLEFAADRQFQGGRVLDFISLQQMEAPWQSRQNRLAGPGVDANDPGALGNLLVRLRSQIVAAEQHQTNVFQNNPRDDAAFRAAALELQNLRDRAQNVRQALDHLADTSNRNASVQERLSRLTQERDARRSFGATFLGADNDGRAQLLRSLAFARQAVQQGSIDNFPAHIQRDILGVLGQAGNSTLDFGNGRRMTGTDAHNMLVDRALGGVFGLSGNQRSELQGLQDTIVDRFEVAERAMTTLVQDLDRSKTDFFQNLTQQHSNFFSQLAYVFLNRSQRDRDISSRATVAATRGELQTFAGHRDALASVGITTDSQVASFQRNRGDFEAYVAAQNRANDLRTTSGNVLRNLPNNIFQDRADNGGVLRGQVIPRFGGDTLDLATVNSIRQAVTENGGTQEQVADIVREFNRRAQEIRSQRNNPIYANQVTTRGNIPGMEEVFLRASASQDLLRRVIEDRIRFGPEMLASGAEQQRIGVRLGQNAPNLDAQRIFRGLTGANGNAILAGGRAFGDQENRPAQDRITLASLPNQIDQTGREFARLTTNIDNLNRALEGMAAARPESAAPASPPAQPQPQRPNLVFGPPGFNPFPQFQAAGGLIGTSPVGFSAGSRPNQSFFRPKGTDTVPAMLSPSEFVVNAASAKANLGLLHRINAAKGPLYRANGDLILPFDEEAVPVGLGPNDIVPDGRSNLTPEPPELIGIAPQRVGPRRAQRPVRPALDPLEAQVQLFARQNPFGSSAQFLGQRNVFNALQAARSPELERRWIELGRGQVQANANNLINREAAIAAGRQTWLFQHAFGGGTGSRLGAGIVSQGFASNLQQRQRLLHASGQNHSLLNGLGALNQFNAEATRGSFFQFGRYASGGVVRGVGASDSVPSLLTPGEGVLNRSAMARIGTAGLLTLNRGGVVPGYLANGGQPGISTSSGGLGLSLSTEAQSAMNAFATNASQLNVGLQAFSQSATAMRDALNSFAGHATSLSDSISKMPHQIQMTGNHKLEVTVNGTEAFARMTPAIEQMVLNNIRSEMNRVFSTHMPEAGITV